MLIRVLIITKDRMYMCTFAGHITRTDNRKVYCLYYAFMYYVYILYMYKRVYYARLRTGIQHRLVFYIGIVAIAMKT